MRVEMETSPTVPQDTGLQCLALLLRFHQVSADPAQIAHQFSGAPIGAPEMLRCAKDLKLKARAVATNWAGLTKLPLPAIVELKDKTFIIVGKVTAGDALVQLPSENRPGSSSAPSSNMTGPAASC